MTDKEKAVVMAFTGIVMLEGEKFSVFHKYIEDICGRRIYLHEMGDKKLWEEIEEKSKDDFAALCRSADPIDRVLEVIDSLVRESNITIDNYNDVAIPSKALKAAVLALKGGDQE